MSDSNAALISQLQQTQVDNGIIFGLSTLVFYEYVITLQEEIDIWKKKRWNAATVLFLVNRYLMIIYNAIGIVIPLTAESCLAIQVFLDVLNVLQFLVFAVFAALRIYAIWNRNIPLSLLILALNMIPVVSNIYDFATDTITFFVDPIAGPQCFEASTLSDSLNFRLSLATRLALMVADLLVLLLTWRRTFGMQAKAARLHLNMPFVTCIIRDGTIYFIALLLMNIAQITMKEFPEFSAFPPTILFINSLTPVLISRFLINLRNVESTITSSGGGGGGGEGDHGQGFSVTGVSTMRFDAEGDGAQSRVDRIIGPMGEDLEDGSAFTSTDDEEESSGSSAYRTEEDGEKLHHEVPTVGVDDSAEKDGHAGIDIQEVSRNGERLVSNNAKTITLSSTQAQGV